MGLLGRGCGARRDSPESDRRWIACSCDACLGCRALELCDSLHGNHKHYQPVEENPAHRMLVSFRDRRGVLGVADEDDPEVKDGYNR